MPPCLYYQDPSNDCVRNGKGQVVGIRLVEKGGKERIAPVLNAYKERVTLHRGQGPGSRQAPVYGL